MPPADPATLSAALATVRLRMADPSLTGGQVADGIVARELVRLLDAGELVRVRPLVWNYRGYSGGFWAAQGAFGPYTVDDAGWCFNGGYENYHDQPIEQSKAECDAHNRARLAAALEPLIAKEVGT